MVCFDTSVIVAFLRGDEETISMLKGYRSKDQISITAITEYELLKHKDKIKRDLTEEVIKSIQIYPFNRAAAAEAAMIFNRLKESGSMINENDILIAGIAISNNESLVTRDKKFGNIKDDRIIVV